MKLFKRLKMMSIASKNVFILLVTLLPFIFGLIISLLNTSNLEYFGTAINISGSERMRTMLIASFLQDYHYTDNEDSRELLESEMSIYVEYMIALRYGDDNITGADGQSLAPNQYKHITDLIDEFASFKDMAPYAADILADPSIENDDIKLFDKYIFFVNYHLEHRDDDISLDYVIEHSLELKNKINEVVLAYETEYNQQLADQENVYYIVVLIALIFTLVGIYLSKIIKKQEYNATYDYLTGLKTRRMIFENVKGIDPSTLSAFFVDLDKFKYINDTYGHLIGDEVLIEVSNRLRNVFSPLDVYRYGGDEFIVLKEDKDIEETRKYITDISTLVKNKLSEPIIDSKNRVHHLSFSMGVVTSSVESESINELLDLADDLMYDSKNYNSQIIICDSKNDALYRKELKQEVYQAISNHQITPYFQAVKDISDQIIFYEVLPRWTYKGKTLLPQVFIPLLRRSGLIEDLDILMLKEVHRIIHETDELGNNPLNLSVNVNKKTLQNIKNNGYETLLDEMLSHQDRFIVEIAEGIMSDSSLFDEVLRLSDKQFSIILDDFKLGNTSLDALQTEYIDYIKIDKSILSDESSYHRSILVELITQMHAAGKKVIINNIDSASDLELAKTYNIDAYQGDFISKITCNT